MTRDDRIRVEPVGRCLLASLGTPSAPVSALAEALPEDDGERVAVVMSHAPAERMAELAARLQPWAPIEWESIRLVAAYAGASTAGGPPAAQVLADQLGIEVLAPDGQLLVVPGGTLFVVGGQDRDSRGGWWRFRPGRDPERDARRFPAPQWENRLAAFNEPVIPDVVIEEIPAGLWIHRPGPARRNDLAFAIPVNAGAMSLVFSRPGDPPLRRDDVWRLIEAVPVELYDRLTIVPYGDRPVEDARLGAIVSLAANRTLRVRTGMPLLLDAFGGGEVVAVGADGEPTWRPFALEMAWRPHAGARVLRCVRPSESLLPHAPAQLLLTKRWLVEVIEAGLWIREIDRTDSDMTIRGLALDSRYCTVVVGVSERGVLPPWRAIDRLLRRLPGDAQERLRLVVPLADSHRAVRSAAGACARMLGDESVYLLSAGGEFLPWGLRDGGGRAPARARAAGPVRPSSGEDRGPVRRAGGRVDGPAARRGRRPRPKPAESMELARPTGFDRGLRRLSDLDGVEAPDRPPEVDRAGGGVRSPDPGVEPPEPTPSRLVPVPDLVLGGGHEPPGALPGARGPDGDPGGDHGAPWSDPAAGGSPHEEV